MNKIFILIFTFLSILLLTAYYASITYSYDNDNKLHITIVGKKEDTAAKNLYNFAIQYAPKNSLIQLWDSREGKQLNSGVEYPVLDKAAAYICMKYKCSLPAFTTPQLQTLIQHFTIPSLTSSSAQEGEKNKTLDVKITNNNVISSQKNIALDTAPNEQTKMARMLETKNLWLIIPIFWFFGFLLALTPCVLPIILIFTSILGGNAATLGRKKVFSLSLTYVIALASTYAIAGMVVASFGFYLQAYMQNIFVLGGFSFLFFLLGISLLGFFNFQLPSPWRKIISKYSKTRSSSSYIGIAVMGILATLIASPCVAAPLAGMLAYVAKSGNAKLGSIALFSTGLGIGTPLILISTVGIELLQIAGEWQKYIKQFFGLLLLGIAIWLLQRIVSPKGIMMLWSSLAIFTAIYMGVLIKQEKHPASDSSQGSCSIDGEDSSQKHNRTKNIAYLSKMISIMILVYGITLLVGSLIGNTNPFLPLERQELPLSTNIITMSSFQHVKNLNELEQSIIAAQAKHKPIMFIFSARWCTACKEMDNDVIPDPRVQRLLPQFFLLYADLTDFNSEDITVAKHFDVIGPPTILFFDDTGAKSNIRIDGAISAEKLSTALQLILNGML